MRRLAPSPASHTVTNIAVAAPIATADAGKNRVDH
jgi:hypothetical protein